MKRNRKVLLTLAASGMMMLTSSFCFSVQNNVNSNQRRNALKADATTGEIRVTFNFGDKGDPYGDGDEMQGFGVQKRIYVDYDEDIFTLYAEEIKEFEVDYENYVFDRWIIFNDADWVFEEITPETNFYASKYLYTSAGITDLVFYAVYKPVTPFNLVYLYANDDTEINGEGYMTFDSSKISTSGSSTVSSFVEGNTELADQIDDFKYAPSGYSFDKFYFVDMTDVNNPVYTDIEAVDTVAYKTYSQYLCEALDSHHLYVAPKFNVADTSFEVNFDIDLGDSKIDLGKYKGSTLGEIINNAIKANGKKLYDNCPDGYTIYSSQTESEYFKTSTLTKSDLPSTFTLSFIPKEHVAKTSANINFKDGISSVKPGEEFTIEIKCESTRTGTTWSSVDVSIYSDFFSNYVSYVSSKVVLEDGTLYNDVNGKGYETLTTPYSYHAAISFDNDRSATQYDVSKTVTFFITFKLSEDAQDIYGTDVGFYTYPTSNKFVYANGVTDTRNAVSTNYTRTNQLVFTVDQGENVITYKPGSIGNEAEYSETKFYNQEEIAGQSVYKISSTKFTSTGYTQIGWATIDGGEKVYDFGEEYKVNKDLVLYPAWEGTLNKITFNSNGGSSVDPISAISGFAIDEPEAPTKDGYLFKGWYLENNIFVTEYEFDKMPNKDITLYAKWEKNVLTPKTSITDSYEYIVLEGHEENTMDGDTLFNATYYYRETYDSVGLVHGEEAKGTRVVLGKVLCETTIEEFLNHFETESKYIRITSADGRVVYNCGEVPEYLKEGTTTEALIADPDYFIITTGTKVEFVIDDTVYDTIYVSVLGDINKDGLITASDYDRLRTRIKTCTINDYDLEVILACYVYNDGSYEKFLFADEYSVLRKVAKGDSNELIKNYISRNTYYSTGGISFSTDPDDTNQGLIKVPNTRKIVAYYKKED